jgi:hypothetical protein
MYSQPLLLSLVVAEGTYVLINLSLYSFLLAYTTLCQQFELSSALGLCTHKPLPVSALVSGPAELALRSKTSSEPAVS